MSLFAVVEGGPALLLSDEQSRERIVLASRRDGPSIRVIDDAGATRWKAP